MKKTIFLLFTTAVLTVWTVVTVSAQSRALKETHDFAVKDGQTLSLDRYYTHSVPGTEISERKPCVIFMFGGAFARGTRDREDYIPYFDFLVDKGYSVVSIDYRLGLKDIDFTAELDPAGFIELLHNTIFMAVDDLFDATNFVIAHSDDWGVDTSRIIANGSSAGAVTVLQAEYEICNGGTFANKLPAGFNYEGIISFAGAILRLNTDLEWAVKPCPIQMFHGDADMQVPYDAVREMGAGFFGSKYIARSLADRNFPFYFYSVENAGHELASVPIRENWEEVTVFIDKFIEQNRPLMLTTEVKEIGKEEVKKNFTIEDYVIGNFVR